MLGPRDASDRLPLLPRVGEVEEAPHTSMAPPTFGGAHARALGQVRAFVGSPSARPAGLLEPAMLAAVNDLLDLRVRVHGELARIEAREQARDIARAFVELAAALIKDDRLDAAATLQAFIAPGAEERAPFLLRLATQSVHDRPMAEAMCALIVALGQTLGRTSVTGALLALDSPAQLRTAESLPRGLGLKYTDFLGRLMGDGEGEWDDDGAVHAIGRLKEADLLPDQSQVRAQYSSRRWEKLRTFVDASARLREVAPWSEASSRVTSSEEAARRLEALLSAASGWTDAASGTVSAPRQGAGEGIARRQDQVIRQVVDEALRQGWANHKVVTRNLAMDVTLAASCLAQRQVTKLLTCACGHLTRMPKQAPSRVFERVLAEVLRDPSLQRALAQEPQREACAGKGRGKDIGADATALARLEQLATHHVKAVLDQRQKLAGVLPPGYDVDDYCLTRQAGSDQAGSD
jgi:hypothetical protein